MIDFCMTVCSAGPTWILMTALVGIVLAAFAIWGMYHWGRPKHKLVFAYTSILIFLILVIGTYVISLGVLFEMNCGGGGGYTRCMPFEITENGTCTLDGINRTEKECANIQNNIDNMSEEVKSRCPEGYLVILGFGD